MTFEVWHIHFADFEVWNGSLLGYEGIAILPYCQAELDVGLFLSGERTGNLLGIDQANYDLGIPSKQHSWDMVSFG